MFPRRMSISLIDQRETTYWVTLNLVLPAKNKPTIKFKTNGLAQGQL